MAILSRLKSFATAGVGACIGGFTVYYGGYVLKSDKNEQEKIPYIKETVNLYEKWDRNWDKRDPASLIKPLQANDEASQNAYNEKLEKHKAKAQRHIFLIRHGQYNVKGKTDKERTLTELGENQACLTGERLKILNHPYTSIIKSTMTRADQTGTLISKYLPDVPVQNCSMIEEGAPIQPEPPHRKWKPKLYKFYTDGARIEAAFRKYIHRAPPDQEKDSYDVIVCHGNVIRYFICRALQIPANAWLRLNIHHASISWITITPSGNVILRQYSDVGYMAPENIST